MMTKKRKFPRALMIFCFPVIVIIWALAWAANVAGK